MTSPKLLFLRVARAFGLFQVAQYLTRRSLKILCYHGFEIADEASFRPKLFISPKVFEERLSTLERFGFRILHLEEAIESLYAGTLPENALVITVDDGFHSFFSEAFPRLRSRGWPSTVYLTTYYVEHPNPIFRLALQYLFWKTSRTTVSMDEWPGGKKVFGESCTTISLEQEEEKNAVLWKIIEFGERELDEDERIALAREVGRFLNVSYDEIASSKLFHLMTPDEVRSAAWANVDFELHTHRHIFPNDDLPAARKEIEDNRESLRRILGESKSHFCYPSGLWAEHQSKWLDELGIKSSTTCLAGLNGASTPRHALRRFLDGENIHQLEFEAAISGFTDLVRGR